MGNGYNPHLHHHHHHHHQNLNQRSMFLPMLCSRPSIKDAHLPKWKHRSPSSSDDPSSPKISCIGQVKRNNRVIGYPTSHKLAGAAVSGGGATTGHHHKYSKLKRLFSGKNLISAAHGGTSTTTGGGNCRRREVVDDYVSVNVLELDPPLPVVRRVQEKECGRDAVDLWKRRSGGVSLKSLQIQQIHVPNNHFLQPTTV